MKAYGDLHCQQEWLLEGGRHRRGLLVLPARELQPPQGWNWLVPLAQCRELVTAGVKAVEADQVSHRLPLRRLRRQAAKAALNEICLRKYSEIRIRTASHFRLYFDNSSTLNYIVL